MTTVMNILNTLAEKLDDKKLKDYLQSGDKDGAIGRGFEILIDAQIRNEARLAQLEQATKPEKEASKNERQQILDSLTRARRSAGDTGTNAGASANAPSPAPAAPAASAAPSNNAGAGKAPGSVPGVHEKDGPAKAG